MVGFLASRARGEGSEFWVRSMTVGRDSWGAFGAMAMFEDRWNWGASALRAGCGLGFRGVMSPATEALVLGFWVSFGGGMKQSPAL